MKEHSSTPVGTVIATDASTETEPLEWELVHRLFDTERWYLTGDGANRRSSPHPAGPRCVA